MVSLKESTADSTVDKKNEAETSIETGEVDCDDDVD